MCQRGKKDEHENHDNVLDHQPSQCNPPGKGLDDPLCLESSKDNDGAGHRKSESEYETGEEIPPPEGRKASPNRVATPI